MRTALILLALALCSCKAAKPLPVDSLPPHAVLLALDSLERHQLTPAKAPFLSRLFGGGGTAFKNKGVININTQNASHGSTIGASAQSGNDESKTKGSATSEATAANTGGQGSKVEGTATSSATNTPKGGFSWWTFGLGAAAMLAALKGPGLLKAVSPLRGV